MMIGARTAAWAKSGAPLPYLRRVAYLETDGASLIETNLIIDNTLTGSLDFEVSHGAAGQAIIFGRANTRFGLRQGPVDQSSSYWGIMQVYNESSYYYGPDTLIGRHKFELLSYAQGSRVIYKYDGRDRTGGANTGSITRDRKLWLFGSGTSFAKDLRIYGASFSTSTETFEMIPVLDLSGRPAMYDEVSGQLFYNQGTGEFTWGELET